MNPRSLQTLLLFTLLAAPAGCSWLQSRDAAKKEQAVLTSPLNALAEKGDVEAMQVVADIEVLRAQGVFSDSAANALAALPASGFLAADATGKLQRAEVGQDITTLLDYSHAEPALLMEKLITAADATEIRRLANFNTTAAADMAVQLKARRSAAPH
jgi:hypothetical protein